MSKRPILAILHRKEEGQRNSVPIWSGRYGKIGNALSRAVKRGIEEGQPGDVVELSHAELGFEIGSVKLGLYGNTQIDLSPLTTSTKRRKLKEVSGVIVSNDLKKES